MKIPITSEKGHIRSKKKTGIIRRLYDWVLHWAHTPYGMPALFFLSLAESSFFPIPPDVLLIALAVSVPARSFRFALVCATGSVIGGTLGYLIGMNLWYAADGAYSAFANLFFTYIPGFSYEGFDKVKEMYNSNAFLAVFTAGFTPIPYKIFTIAGGVCKINFSIFIIASSISRACRFFLVAAFIYKFGPTIVGWIDKYFDKLAILFTILLIAGFAVIKLVF
jgi:membrane protein YqaA with SNARE-associated domain